MKVGGKKAIFRRWYGFDLDGTIADNSLHGSGLGEIGEPIKPMCNLMRKLYRGGCDVRIVTARLRDVGCLPEMQDEVKRHIWEWCDKNLGFRPAIVDNKDALMEVLYDDRARQVIRNKGVDKGELAEKLAKMLGELLEKPKKNRKRAEGMYRRCQRLGLC